MKIIHACSRGITLVELLIATYVLLTGICGVLLLFTTSMTSTQNAWDSTVAASHAQYVLEEMQSKATLESIINADWEEWIEAQNIKSLPEESLNVQFPDPGANPLDITVTVQWKRPWGNTNIALSTKLTR